MAFTDSQTSEFVYSNIVKIVDEKGNFYGTAFCIEENQRHYIVTCHHCIYKLNQIFIEKNKKLYGCNWLREKSDMSKDVAIMQCDDPPIKPIYRNRQLLPLLEAFVWGFSAPKLRTFPEGSPVENGKLSEASFLFHWEEGSKGDNEWNNKGEVNVNVFGFNGKFDVGFSGAPVCYAGDKKVVGMFCAKDNDSGYVIPIETVTKKIETKEILPSIRPTISQDMVAVLEEGNKLYYRRDFPKAIEKYDKVIKDPNYLTALSNKGRGLSQMGKNKEAIELFNVVLSIDQDFLFALNGMGLASFKAEQYEDAIMWLDKAIAIDPNYVDAINNLGNCFSALAKGDKAMEQYDKVLAIDPNHDTALANKGIAYYARGEDKKAMDLFDNALAINPKNVHALNGRGKGFLDEGQLENAMEFFDKATGEDQEFVEALNNKGKVYQTMGEYKNAMECFEKIRTIKAKK